MIRRISANNDYRDIVRSCPSGVIDDIYAIEYYVKGYDGVYNAAFSKTGHLLEVIIPSSALKTLHSGLLMRRAKYSNEDSSFPDGNYDLEFVESMDVWLDNGNEPGPGPVPGEYVTEEELAETLGDYATIDYVDEAISEIPSPENVVQYDLDHPLIEDFGLNVDVIKREEFDYGTSVMTKGLVLAYEERKLEDVVKVINTIELRGNQLWKVNYDKTVDYQETRDPYVLQSDLSSYATQQWVGQQGYLTSASMSGYATQQWVDNELMTGGYLTENMADQRYPTFSWIESAGYVVDDPNDPIITESALDSVLAGDDNRVLREDDLGPYAQMSWVQDQGYASDSDLDALDARVSVLEHGGGPSSVSWGGISGTVTDQTDLVNYIGSQGFLTSSDLSGYATESYVQNQGYITSSALSGYATESWATNQFLEESKVWSGTQAQWNQLSASQQASYTIALITQ